MTPFANFYDLPPGMDPGFVWPEAYTVFGALFMKKNAHLPIKNWV
jgi:hypothetical protein